MLPFRLLFLLVFFLAQSSWVFAGGSAEWITNSSQLLQGSGAVGQLGDVLLSNGEISVVITAIEHPHSYASSGGCIVDAALTSDGVDAFGQLYLYLNDDWPRQANYSALTIEDNGTGFNPAHVQVVGVDTDNSSLGIVTDYYLGDGDSEVTIVTTLTNSSASGLTDFELGDATEWNYCEAFAPGYGFNVSGTTYEKWLAASSGALVYGYFAHGETMWGPNGNAWADVNVTSVDIAAGQDASFTRYFHVGDGGVASVASRAHDLAGLTVGFLSGTVIRDDNANPINAASVDVYDGDGSLYTQMITNESGQGQVSLEPGNWRLVAQASSYSSVEQWYTVNPEGTTNFSFLMNEGSSSGSYALGDTLTVIQKPILSVPVIAPAGSSFTINCEADPATTGWAATLRRGEIEVFLTLESAAYNTATTWWDLQVQVPEMALFEMYDLRVTADGGVDDSAHNAVQVIETERLDFYFLHITDTHLPTHLFYDNAASLTDTSEVEDLRAIIQDVKLINPAFVLHTGDLINEGELEDYEQRRYYSRSKQVLGEMPVPVYLIAGNHDIGGWNSTPPSSGTARRDWWRFYGWKILNDPPAGAPLFTQNYSFDYAGVHFTAIEAYDNYDMWRSQIYGDESFTQGQMNWLANDLSESADSLAQVLFYHYDFSGQINLTNLGADMALWGHIHSSSGSLASPPYDLSTDNVSDGARSYRLIRVHNGVLDPRPTLSAGGAGEKLQVQYGPSNYGAADSVRATITNLLSEGFPNGQVIFNMPASGGSGARIPSVEGGTLVQIDESGSLSRWYVEVDIVAEGTTMVSAKWTAASGEPLPSNAGLVLHPGFPNPFNPSTNLSYSLPERGHVRVAIIDLRGREVALLVDEYQESGEHSVVWNAMNRSGQALPSGTFIAHVSSGGVIRTTKITLAK